MSNLLNRTKEKEQQQQKHYRNRTSIYNETILNRNDLTCKY